MSDAVRPTHLVVPDAVDDPRRPSGGNTYDRRLARELRARGWPLRVHRVPGAWPQPAAADRVALHRLVAGVPDGTTVVVDGLIASAAEELATHGRRLRLVVLLHMPLAEADPDPGTVARERTVLGAAAAVVTTSDWGRRWVVEHHGLPARRVHVARPGVDPGPVVAGSATGGRLLCVGPVTRAKGHDTLVAALALVRDLGWECTCAGAVDLDPPFAADLAATVRRTGIAGRVDMTGALSPDRLEVLRAGTDLVVSASRRESFGMAVTEGLARGIPVVATDVGGHAEAVGATPDGAVPGLLVPPGDPARLADALRRWLTEPTLREELRRTAVRRREALDSWSGTARRVEAVLTDAGLVAS